MFTADVRDAPGLKTAAAACDTVFHLAARVHEISVPDNGEADYRSHNVDGTRNVLAAAAACGIERFVFVSSVKAIGDGAPICIDELFSGAPKTSYGRSKLEAERLVFQAGRATGMHVACIRPPLVYGRGNRGNLVRMIAAIDAGRFPPLPDSGNRRSILHVANLTDGLLLAATHSRANGECYIVTDTHAYSTRALYEMIVRALGRRVPRWSAPGWALKTLAMGGDAVGAFRGRPFTFNSDVLARLMESSWYSSAKITRELGYEPRVSFEQALPDLIAWYRTPLR
jgi:nucleoside-diphosphate-sugar epimerase